MTPVKPKQPLNCYE